MDFSFPSEAPIPIERSSAWKVDKSSNWPYSFAIPLKNSMIDGLSVTEDCLPPNSKSIYSLLRGVGKGAKGEDVTVDNPLVIAIFLHSSISKRYWGIVMINIKDVIG